MVNQRVSSRGDSLLIPIDVNRNHFNFLRLAMAVLVICSHSFALYYGSEDNEPISRLLNGVFNSGNVAVRVFFIVSGFLISISYLRSRSLFGYFKKRVARIYPGFLVAMLVCTVVVIPLFSTHMDWSARALVRTALRALVLHDDFPASNVFADHYTSTVNGSVWSILLEFWCYIGLAGLGLVGLLRRRWFILFAMLAILATKTWLDIKGLKPGGGFIGEIIGWPYRWFSIAPCFLAGMLAYLYRDVLPRSAMLALALLLALIASAHVAPVLCDALFPLVIAYLTFFVAFSKVPLPDAARYGDFSYGTYLYGFPIQQMLWEAHVPFVAYLALAILLSVLAGIASWFLVEKPFLSQKSHGPVKEGLPPVVA